MKQQITKAANQVQRRKATRVMEAAKSGSLKSKSSNAQAEENTEKAPRGRLATPMRNEIAAAAASKSRGRKSKMETGQIVVLKKTGQDGPRLDIERESEYVIGR